MSPLVNATTAIGASTFELWRQIMNISVNYQDAVSAISEKVTTSGWPDIFELTRSTNSTELSIIAAAAGAVGFFTITGVWSICKILTRSREPEDNVSPNELLQLIKKAYLPGCTETVIEQLCKQDIDINRKVTTSGLTYFLCGCLSGAADLIKYMIKLGADVNSVTNDGDSALYLATYAVLHSIEPSTDTLRVLIKAGCSVNKQNRLGYTPLHRAASKGNLKVIQYLLLEGADPYIANHAGVYPIDSAVCAGHIEAARLLKLKFPSPHVWDVVEPHTPPHIKMGLQSPQRKLMLDSFKHPRFRNVFT